MTQASDQKLGYRRLPASDPQEQDFRDEWYRAKKDWVDAGAPDSGRVLQSFQYAEHKLSDYLWKRSLDEREQDRMKHPKARRNQPLEFQAGDGTPTRVLP